MADMSQPDGEKKQDTAPLETDAVPHGEKTDGDRAREAVAASIKNNLEPANPAVLAGTDLVGFAAESPAFIAARDEALRVNNKASSQELQEQETFDNNPYGSHTAGQMRQFHAEQSGSGGGLYAGTLASQLREEEFVAAEKRKDEDTAYLINSMTSTFKEIQQDFKKFEQDFQRTSNRFDRESKDTVEALDTLGDKIKEMEEARKEGVERIQKLEERLKASPGDQSIQDQLKLERAALENNDVVLHLYKETHQSTTESLNQLRVQYGEAQKQVRDLRHQLENAEKNGGDPKAIEDLKRQLDAARENRSKLDRSLDQLKDKVEFTRKVTEHEFSKKVDISACYSPEVTKQKVEILQARTILVSAVLEAGQNGVVTAEELRDIGKLAKKADVDKADVEEFAKSFAESGIAITDENGQAIKGEDAGKFIMSAWDQQVKTASIEVKRDIATVNVSMSKINAELAGVDAQIAALEKGAAATTAAIGNRQTVREFMDQNFSVTGFGEKESIFAVGRDPSRQLKDKTGNVVYMDTNEQFYYLKKDAEGKVAKDANGDQIKVYYSKEDPTQVVDLQRKLFQEEKLPRNFFPPMTSSTNETSQYDGFVSAYNRSDKASTQKFAENAQAAIQAQKDSTEANREQLAKLTTQKQTLEKVKAIVESPEFKRKAAELAADGRLSHNDLKQLAGGDTQLARGLARALSEGKNSVAIGDAPAPKQPTVARAATTEKAATGQRTADEVLALATPKHTPQEAADFKSKLEARLAEIKHGGASATMSKDEYQSLAARAEELGLKRELDQGMRKNNLEVNDNGIVQQKPEPVAAIPTFKPVPGTGIVAQATPIIVASNAPSPQNGVFPTGMAFQSAADEYVPLNGLTASTMPVNNGTDKAPEATVGFQKILDSAPQLAAASSGGMTEQQLRAQQIYELQRAELAARMASNPTSRGIGGAGGGGVAQT